MSSVLIVGGGIAGLSAAREILRRGGDPLVLEASERAGGYLRSEKVDGALIEHGPQGFLGERPGALDLVDDLGLGDELVPASDTAKTRYLLHDGSLVPLPMSPPALLKSPLLSWRGKLRLLGEPWAGPPPTGAESVHDFAARRIGREAADVLVDAAVTGIFAGDPHALSLDACFPKMRRMEREHGSLFRAMRARKRDGAGPAGKRLHSFRSGMQALADAYAVTLGERVRCSSAVTTIARDGSGYRVTVEGGEAHEARALVLAVPARFAAPLVRDLSPTLAKLLEELVTAPVAVVGALFARDAVPHPLDGYGFLVPGGRYPVLGCLFESSVFPGRAPEGKVLLRMLAGGARRPELVDDDRDAITEKSLRAIRPLIGTRGEPDLVRCVVHRHAIPQYAVDHPARLAAIDEAVHEVPHLHLTGAAYRGVAVNHLVAEGARTANEVLSR